VDVKKKAVSGFGLDPSGSLHGVALYCFKRGIARI
jgi:hypothetical protein